MNRFVFLCMLLLALLSSFNGSSQLADSTQRDTVTAVSPTWQSEDSIADDDFAPGLLFLTLIGIGLISVCIGIGSIVTIVLLALLFGFISLGILSSSVIVGLNRRSFTAGFKTFIVSITSVARIVLGITALYLTNYLFDLHLSHSITLCVGAGGGLVAGFILGLISFIMLQQFLRFFKQRLDLYKLD
jgi:hypothetical protein